MPWNSLNNTGVSCSLEHLQLSMYFGYPSDGGMLMLFIVHLGARKGLVPSNVQDSPVQQSIVPSKMPVVPQLKKNIGLGCLRGSVS